MSCWGAGCYRRFPGSELYGARQAGTPAVRGHGTAAGHSHPGPNDIDPQGLGRSGRDATAPGPGLDRAWTGPSEPPRRARRLRTGSLARPGPWIHPVT